MKYKGCCPAFHPHPPEFLRANSLWPGSTAVLKIFITDSSSQLARSALNSVIMKLNMHDPQIYVYYNKILLL